MTDTDRLNKIDSKLDRLIEVVGENHAENMQAHGVIEGQNLDERVSKMESKFWPAVGAAAVVIPLLTGLAVSYIGG